MYLHIFKCVYILRDKCARGTVKLASMQTKCQCDVCMISNASLQYNSKTTYIAHKSVSGCHWLCASVGCSALLCAAACCRVDILLCVFDCLCR